MIASDNIKSGVYLAAIAAAGYVAYQAYKKAGALGDGAAKAWDSASSAAATVGGWVNPASDQNLAYQGVNAVGSYASGDVQWTLGGAVFDKQQERGFSNPWQVFAPSSAGLIAGEIKDFFTGKPEPLTSGGGGKFTGTGATGAW